jgi:hypothetical protein
MQELFILLLLTALYFPVTLLVNRALLAVFPQLRQGPAQGIIAMASLLSFLAFVAAGAWILGKGPAGIVVWAVYLAIVIGCMALVYVSTLCVSESGRRFYLMHLIEQSGGMPLEALRKAYTRDHMLSIRIDRLMAWKILEKSDSHYRLVRISPYLYSRCFHIWGRLLGIKWF